MAHQGSVPCSEIFGQVNIVIGDGAVVHYQTGLGGILGLKKELFATAMYAGNSLL